MAGLFQKTMNITHRLLELDKTLHLHNEGEWGNTTLNYSAFNDAGVECEVGEFLYSLVRVLKPKRVLETGTHKGIGASYMGVGLLDNGFGELDTIEFLPEIHAEAHQRIKTMGLETIVHCNLIDAANFKPPTDIRGSDWSDGDYVKKKMGIYQLILLDTEPQTRFAELLKFYPYLQGGGFLFIHDLHRHMHQIANNDHGFAWPFGKIPEAIAKLVKTGEIRPFHLPTPRGLTGFYKASEDDYDWG